MLIFLLENKSKKLTWWCIVFFITENKFHFTVRTMPQDELSLLSKYILYSPLIVAITNCHSKQRRRTGKKLHKLLAISLIPTFHNMVYVRHTQRRAHWLSSLTVSSLKQENDVIMASASLSVDILPYSRYRLINSRVTSTRRSETLKLRRKRETTF